MNKKQRLPHREELRDNTPYYYAEGWKLNPEQKNVLQTIVNQSTTIADQHVHAVFLEPDNEDPLRLFCLKIVYKRENKQ